MSSHLLLLFCFNILHLALSYNLSTLHGLTVLDLSTLLVLC